MPPVKKTAKSVADRLKEAGAGEVSIGEIPLWKGPQVDGITQSLLSRFIVCPHRFWLLTVKGLRPAEGFNHRLEYGNLWHAAEEEFCRNGDWEKALVEYAKKLTGQHRTQQEQVEHWYNVCRIQFPLYIKYWEKHPDMLSRVPVFQEKEFAVKYYLPSGRYVVLRGKFDAVDIVQQRGKPKVICLQENKTKGDIDKQGLLRQLQFDMQTMIYIIALKLYMSEEKRSELTHKRESKALRNMSDLPIAMVRYNVIRRPLSGGAGTIRQHKPSKSNPHGESLDEFYNRLRDDVISQDPDNFFMRWNIDITPQDVARFENQFLVPKLENLCDWWESIQLDILDPWTAGAGKDYAGPNPYHYRFPYGVYNPMLEGGYGETDEYLNTGSEVGLRMTKNLFPELSKDLADVMEG